jgi:hypothetical protein
MKRRSWPPPQKPLKRLRAVAKEAHHEDQNGKGDGEKMLTKNTRASVTTIAVALIMGVMVALSVALMPAPAQAQPGDVLRLLSLKALDITNNECPGDCADDPLIFINSNRVWSADDNNVHLKNGDSVNLEGVSATLSEANAEVQLQEMDPGVFQGGRNELIGEFSAAYTDGTEQTQTLNYRNGEAVYQIKYVVDRASTPTNTPPEMLDFRPAPGSSTQNRTPLISATVRDAETDLDGSTIKLSVDGIERAASYDKASDKLSYKSAKLAPGQHTVRIEATDASGLKGQNTWNFKVVRRH